MHFEKEYWLVFFRFLTLIYLVAIGWVLFVKVGSIERRIYFKELEVNIIPFEVSLYYLEKAIEDNFSVSTVNTMLRNIIGNILLFVPLGFLGPLAFNRLIKTKNIALLGIFLSVSAELCQYLFAVGILDIDDIIYNTLGTITGCKMLKLTNYI